MIKDEPMTVSIILNSDDWLLKITPEGKFIFNHELYPDSNPSDFAQEFIGALEKSEHFPDTIKALETQLAEARAEVKVAEMRGVRLGAQSVCDQILEEAKEKGLVK